jgi:superfamily I DNA/RNA helicase
MSLWWTKKAQLDEEQLALIEKLDLEQSHLVVGPPGCGKTNVLLRRAQYARSQEISNVLVLTFTRPLTEFVKTGCRDDQGREIFPPGLIQTLETWIRSLYRAHHAPLPARPDPDDLTEWKRTLAKGALGFAEKGVMNRYDAIFVDEGQDLLSEELDLVMQWGSTVFFVGDDRQQIYDGSAGASAIKELLKSPRFFESIESRG